MPVLRHLSQRLILSGFRLSPRKWQKIPGCEFLRLRQIWNPEHFYFCSRQICHRHKAKASLRNSWYLSDWSAFRFLCGCASCNCIKTRMFSAHSNIFLYSICMNKKSGIYWNHPLPVWFNDAFSCHAQKICSCSGNMVLKKSLLVQESFSGVVT